MQKLRDMGIKMKTKPKRKCLFKQNTFIKSKKISYANRFKFSKNSRKSLSAIYAVIRRQLSYNLLVHF